MTFLFAISRLIILIEAYYINLFLNVLRGMSPRTLSVSFTNDLGKVIRTSLSWFYEGLER